MCLLILAIYAEINGYDLLGWRGIPSLNLVRSSTNQRSPAILPELTHGDGAELPLRRRHGWPPRRRRARVRISNPIAWKQGSVCRGTDERDLTGGRRFSLGFVTRSTTASTVSARTAARNSTGAPKFPPTANHAHNPCDMANHHALVEGPHRGALHLSPPWRPDSWIGIASAGCSWELWVSGDFQVCRRARLDGGGWGPRFYPPPSPEISVDLVATTRSEPHGPERLRFCSDPHGERRTGMTKGTRGSADEWEPMALWVRPTSGPQISDWEEQARVHLRFQAATGERAVAIRWEGKKKVCWAGWGSFGPSEVM